MSQREDDDLVADDLIRQRKRKAVEDGQASIGSALPLGRRLRELKNRGEGRFELVFELGSETRLSRFVVVDLVVDLDNGQPVNP